MSTNRRSSGTSVVVRMLLGVMAMLTCLWSYAPPAQAASTCAGVWVVVDYGSLGGGAATGCSTSYSTGMAALRSVATVVLDAGMVVRVNGLPQVANIQTNYWSYWHSTRQADGSYSAWSYSSVGPSSYHPTPGEAEGWRYAPVGGGYVAPGVLPPKLTATQPPATTAPATTAHATTAAAKTTTAAARTTQATTATTTSDTAAPASQTPTASDTAVETPAITPVTGDSSSSVSSMASAKPTSTSTSSLLGGAGAIGAIAVGAAGVLFWRKRLAARG